MPKSSESLNARLARLRAEKGYSQSEWAKAAKVHQPQVARWEKDLGEPGIDSLRGLAQYLGISLAALIGDEQPTFAAPRAPTPEEMASTVLSAFGLPKAKLEAMEAVLACDDEDVLAGISDGLRVHRKGISTARKTGKASSG